MSAFIYSLSDPDTGQIRYVGKTFNLKKRFYNHLRDTRLAPRTSWIQGLKAKNKRPVMEELESFPREPEIEWQNAERWWISYLKSVGCLLLNLDAGGFGGGKRSDETRAKLSRPRSESAKLNMRGWHHTEETKRILSERKRGTKQSPSHRAKLSLIRKGRKQKPESIALRVSALTGQIRTPDLRARMSAAQKGRTFTPETIEKMRIAAKSRWMKSH